MAGTSVVRTFHQTLASYPGCGARGQSASFAAIPCRVQTHTAGGVPTQPTDIEFLPANFPYWMSNRVQILIALELFIKHLCVFYVLFIVRCKRKEIHCLYYQ